MTASVMLQTQIVCPACSWFPQGGYATHCVIDGRPLAPRYPLFDIGQIRPRDQLRACFGQLLPLENKINYRELSSLTSNLIDASEMGRNCGIKSFWLKNETTLPTGTTKARMAAVALAYLLECGVGSFVVASTGNSTIAMARLMSHYPEMRMVAYTGQVFASRHSINGTANVELRFVDGDFVGAERAAKEYATANRATWEGGFFNPARRVGLATAYIEACVQMGQHPDWYFQAVSSGMGVVGVGEFAECQVAHGQISRLPRLVAVQQESCAPMVHAFREGCDCIEPRHRIPNPQGIAQAILRGDPTASYPHVRRHVLASGGDIVSVSEAEILAVGNEVQRRYRISAGASAAAAVAAALKLGRMGRIAPDDVILVNLSGRQ